MSANSTNTPAETNISGTPAPTTTSPTSTTPYTAVITTGSHFGTTPSGIRLTLITLQTADWPKDLILDLGKSNWVEWHRQISLVALCHGLSPWLDGSLTCPDAITAPEADFIWKRNDDALRGFMLRCVSPVDIHLVEHLPTAHEIITKLRSIHARYGTFTQLDLLLKGLQINFTYETSLRVTLSEIWTVYQRIIAMGRLKDDDIFSILILNALGRNFGPL